VLDVNPESRFVAFQGSMASGKTTQAQLLANKTDAELLLGEESKQKEIVSGEVFTRVPAIEVEKWFVNYHLGKLAMFSTIPEEGLVSDMSMENDLVWGRALLKGNELSNFEDYYQEASKNVPKPDISLLMLLPPIVLFDRVMKRISDNPNRRFESKTDMRLLDRIQESFIDNQKELGKKTAVLDLRKDPLLNPQEVHYLAQAAIAEL